MADDGVCHTPCTAANLDGSSQLKASFCADLSQPRALSTSRGAELCPAAGQSCCTPREGAGESSALCSAHRAALHHSSLTGWAIKRLECGKKGLCGQWLPRPCAVNWKPPPRVNKTQNWAHLLCSSRCTTNFEEVFVVCSKINSWQEVAVNEQSGTKHRVSTGTWTKPSIKSLLSKTRNAFYTGLIKTSKSLLVPNQSWFRQAKLHTPGTIRNESC